VADEELVERLRDGSEAWNRWRSEHPEIERPDLAGLDLRSGPLFGANLKGAILRDAKLLGSDLRECDLALADLRMADLSWVRLYRANLRGARLQNAKLQGADFRKAELDKADLRSAYLRDANLREARLVKARLDRADLSNAILVETDLEAASLVGCRVYGASVWEPRLAGAAQRDLVITPHDEPDVTVDDLEVAQFLYLMLRNERLRNVIDTVTSRAVLILGRFTVRRKRVLETLRDELRRCGLVPILFDFEPSPSRDLTETVQLLANLVKFVLADLTGAKSIPQELSHVIPFLPSVPIQPLCLASQREYAMFEHWRRYQSVLSPLRYRDEAHLVELLHGEILRRVDRWMKTQRRVTVLEAELKEEKKERRALERRVKALEGAPAVAGP
jgi:uncharacterized protein YjbI with pentapeptide repeats